MKTQGMIEWSKDPTYFDGTKGRHNNSTLQEMFPESPVHTEQLSFGDDDEGAYEASDAGITAFFADVLTGEQTVNTDFKAKEGAANLSMDYASNIPDIDKNYPHKDFVGMEPPYKVPNPASAPPTHPHDPESKGKAPDGYQDRFKKKISFGTGMGADLSIEASSEVQDVSSFTDLLPGIGPGNTPSGG